MNLNHMNKPTVFNCRNCGQTIYKNKRQYHEEYQCVRKNGLNIKHQENQYSQEDLQRNPQNNSLLLQQKPQRKHQRYQNHSYKYLDSKKTQQKIQSYQITKSNRFEQPKMVKKNSQPLKGSQRAQRFCDEYEKRWGMNQQIKVKKDSNKRQQNKNQALKKCQEIKIQEVKLYCQVCYQMIPVLQYEYHFSNCDRIEECQFCGMFMCLSSFKRHQDQCEVKKFLQTENICNHTPKQYVNSINNQIHPEVFEFDPQEFSEFYEELPRQNYESNIFFSTFKKVQKKQQEYLQDSCLICYMKYENGQKIAKLPCLHGYHPECISKWLKLKNSCPVCKTNLESLKH